MSRYIPITWTRIDLVSWSWENGVLFALFVVMYLKHCSFQHEISIGINNETRGMRARILRERRREGEQQKGETAREINREMVGDSERR